jgi:ABC-type uncharacterized transport system substrate-binding protein
MFAVIARSAAILILLPDASTIALLVNPNQPFAETQVNTVQAAARAIGQKTTILKASTVRDIDAAFASVAEIRSSARLSSLCWRCAIGCRPSIFGASSLPPAV